MRRARRLAAGLILVALLSSCATRTQRARTLVALGAVAVAGGLLIAEDCRKQGSTKRNLGSVGCAGTPSAADAARGLAVAAAGGVALAAGTTMLRSQKPRSTALRTGPYRARYRYQALPLPAEESEPAPQMEPQAPR